MKNMETAFNYGTLQNKTLIIFFLQQLFASSHVIHPHLSAAPSSRSLQHLKKFKSLLLEENSF